MSLSSIVSQNQDVLGGTQVFLGTRVPIQNFFDYLKSGSSISEFLKDFPSVKEQQLIELLVLSQTVVQEQSITT